MINPRLFEWYGIDTEKNLGMTSFCPRPYDTVLIDKQGSCYLCECTAWLPQSVGNLHTQSLEDIVNSKMAAELQSSIADGSYRYCNNQQCAWLLDKKNLPDWPENKPAVMIQNIRLAIDNSCNLSCPSCRTKKIFEKDKFQLRKKFQLADKIIDYVRSQPHKINLHIGSDGDPFASLIYRYFIQNIKDLPNIRFTIQTNGLLINKMHERHFEMFRKLDVLNLSIDGATKETYEKLRRGGSFQQLIRNLEYVKNLKNKLNFKFIIHCVIQKDNYKEIPLMVQLSKNYLADKIWFNRITNWNTFKDFDEQDVCNKKNLEHVSYLQIIENVKQSIEYKNNYIETATL